MNPVRIVSVVGVVAALAAAFWWMAPRAGTDRRDDAAADAAPDLTPIAFAIASTTEDRFVPEPCNRITGGGLLSVPAFVGEVRESFPAGIGVSMGDLTLAEGGIARHVAVFHYGEVMPVSGVDYVAVGEGELGLGAGFLRDVLTRQDGPMLLGANVTDTASQPLLRGFALLKAGERGVLLVAVVARSLQGEIARRGSDVLLAPEVEAARRAHAEGAAHAARTGIPVDCAALFVHGTVEETAAVLEAVPGFTFAAAAHGGLLPDAEPREVGGVPILYGGRGLRFGWRAMLPGGAKRPVVSLTRLGERMVDKPAPFADALGFFREISTARLFAETATTPGERPDDPRGAYAGGTRCIDCHQQQGADHLASAHHGPSRVLFETTYRASTGCVRCHTTAPYVRGGWRGPEDRSDMAGVSCEACHGPGLEHASKPGPGYGKATLERCADCHLPDHSPGFDAADVWKRAGHRLR